jgi:hypothetical protein
MPALVALRRRMIEFEDSQALSALEPVGERVEPRAEDEDLPHAPSNRDLCGVFGETAAHGDEEPEAPLLWMLPRSVERVFGVVSENGKRQRVRKNSAALEGLMRRSSPRRAERSSACASVLHEARSYGPGGRLSSASAAEMLRRTGRSAAADRRSVSNTRAIVAVK